MLRAVAPGQVAQWVAGSAVALSSTNTTSEEVLLTVSLPPPGANGGYEIITTWSATNNANVKTARIRLGGAAGTQFAAVAMTSSATLRDSRSIRNRNATNSQVCSTGAATGTSFGLTTVNLTTGSLDWSAALDLVFSTQKATGTDSMALESYEIWRLPG